jgi:hypothetical protein
VCFARGEGERDFGGIAFSCTPRPARTEVLQRLCKEGIPSEPEGKSIPPRGSFFISLFINDLHDSHKQLDQPSKLEADLHDHTRLRELLS